MFSAPIHAAKCSGVLEENVVKDFTFHFSNLNLQFFEFFNLKIKNTLLIIFINLPSLSRNETSAPFSKSTFTKSNCPVHEDTKRQVFGHFVNSCSGVADDADSFSAANDAFLIPLEEQFLFFC